MKRKTVRSAAAAAAAVCTALMMSVCYYGRTLPDEFRTEYGEKLTLGTALPIEAVRAEGNTLEAFAGNGGGERLSLELFGSVPVKEVNRTSMNRPRLCVGGQAFGIKLVTDGVMIIDMKKLSGVCPAREAGLRVGDVIESLNGEQVGSNSRISELIRASGGEDCVIRYRRGDKSRECTLTPVFSAGSYRAGMWVRDSSAGIGTMTFTDPETGAFAGLGHSICDNDTHEPLPLSHGSISGVRIDGVTKSLRGEPGQLLGEFSGEDIGELTLNCTGGVYGIMTDEPTEAVSYPLGFAHEVHEGAAYMIAQTDGGEPERYSVTIEQVAPSDCPHDLIIHTDDSRLIEAAGGIVQGMSGSPIIQDGRLVGAVTHVFVDDPCGGYGIFAETMYENALKAVGSAGCEREAG